ncbi:alpha-isocomene synthase-like [Rutidosis leptorrhynchoides]|uniref:alpha-isocomene synthase-like n=1 Tax=Rutidosis leptorrhynchoides TaxID=125765 RepID=UPI003A98DD12
MGPNIVDFVRMDWDGSSHRPSANFPPSVWGDVFLSYHEPEDEAAVEKVVEELREEIKKEILGSLKDHVHHTSLLRLIDTIQHLGIAYYFENEINQVLQHLYDLYGDNWNGGAVALWFRLMRQHGIFVSSDIFKSYKDTDGAFKEALKKDIEGLLELYEATYLRIPGEVILDDALAFTRNLLDDILKDPLVKKSSFISSQIEEALLQPLHKRLPRLEAIRYISVYQQQDSRNDTLLKLAKLGFNLLQSLHKRELHQVYKWWKSYDVPANLSYTRDRLVECYFWALAVYYEPQYSESRMLLTKSFAMATVLDDTYDAYGTYEELVIFTEAVKRWSVEMLEDLPDKMKLVYRMLVEMYEHMENVLSKMGKAHHINFIKESLIEYIGFYLKEAKWANDRYVPTIEEHKEISVLGSIGYKFTIISCLAAMGDVVKDETFKWAHSMPRLVKSCCVICRIRDDLVSAKEEQERLHVASSIQCYMKEHDHVSEQQVHDLFNQNLEDAWKEMNEELLKRKDVDVPIVMLVINFARSMEVLYTNKDHFTHVGPELINHIKSLFVDPIPI